MFLHGIFILTVWLDKTSNISILSCKLQTPALLPTHVTVGLPQMEGVAYSAICDATFMSRRAHPRHPCCVPRSARRKVHQIEHLEVNKIKCMFKGLKSH